MNRNVVDISKKNKASVLATLYNYSKPQGMGWFEYEPRYITDFEAKEIIEQHGLQFDYLKGRVLKIDLSGDFLDTSLYDRDNGEGSAACLISSIPNEK
ncbi:MAG: hypothetical protein IJ215_02610 [Clostridia bacterium]|nr:hypothetical protein [Clostridia bacterium]